MNKTDLLERIYQLIVQGKDVFAQPTSVKIILIFKNCVVFDVQSDIFVECAIKI